MIRYKEAPPRRVTMPNWSF